MHLKRSPNRRSIHHLFNPCKLWFLKNPFLIRSIRGEKVVSDNVNHLVFLLIPTFRSL